MDKKFNWKDLLVKLLLATAVLAGCLVAAPYILILLLMLGVGSVLSQVGVLLLPCLLVSMVFFKNKWKVFKLWCIPLAVFLVACAVDIGMQVYNDSITIDTAPNINVQEYLPFEEDSKIVRLDHAASLKLEGALPIVDGAAAVFPVYSAFVNAVYPDTTKLYDGVFEHYNTSNGYYFLADGMTDIFFGAYPSERQIQVAKDLGKEFQYTPIGYEAFVFFVHKDNPVDGLTSQQIRDIYAGRITNWKQLGGRDEPIAAFQRNEDSGSQSMLVRFMDGQKLMEPPTELVDTFMSGIIERVSDYKSKSGSIGFSFRYYVEGIIKNPDIKLLSVDGVAPTVENIQNGTYPIITPLYAVTCAGNDNENVQKLIDWVLSPEGQQIIEKTGYAGIG